MLTKNFCKLVFGLMLAGASATAMATPAQVIFIRHGEKPPTGDELNARGQQRAQALVSYFETNPAVTQFGTPVAIYAMGQHGPDGSLRPIQTVTPLAQSLGLTLIETYDKNDYQPMVDEILNNNAYNGKMVLICWEHTVIPSIVQAFGYLNGPASWPGGNVFDRTWILTFSGDTPTTFQDLPQELLPGDSTF